MDAVEEIPIATYKCQILICKHRCELRMADCDLPFVKFHCVMYGDAVLQKVEEAPKDDSEG